MSDQRTSKTLLEAAKALADKMPKGRHANHFHAYAEVVALREAIERATVEPVVTPQHIEAALMALAWVEQFIGDGNPMLARQNLNIAKANLGGGRCDPMPIPSVSTKLEGQS